MPRVRVPRWVFAVVAAAVAVSAVDAGLYLVLRDGPASARAGAVTEGDLVAVVDPAAREVVDRVRVGRSPTAVVAGYGGVWVLNKGDGTLSHLDARSHRVVRTLELDATANDLALGEGGVWLAGRLRDGGAQPLEVAELERLDPATDAVDRRFATRTGADVLAAGGGAVWTTGYLGGHVRGAARSDASTGAMRRVDIGIYGDLITAGDGAVYWVGSIGNRVARVSMRTGRLTASLPLATDASLASGIVPPNPTDAVVGARSLWISTTGGTLYRIAPDLHAFLARIRVCRDTLGVAYGAGGVWLACGNATVVRVDPRTNRADPPIFVGRLPRGIAAGSRQVWVTLD
jgi:DNA-binding beta-propeller fold protein YncE